MVGKELDYTEIGLITGLEVHQQLDTAHKLFCRCPAGVYTREHDGVLIRHMRPTLSELGEYDGTALMEFKTKKNIMYLLHESNVCTYEMDDTPPFLVNQKALDIAIEQCLMLGCDIIDEVHIARKQYLDGSIPTGFQRTTIVGVNGRLPFRGRELSILQVSMEEDSCREVSDQGHLIVWRTDRLGMPLIETVTGPDLRTPEEVVEAILLIGRVCRSTGHVRTGLGASRQDVNVSIRGGRRVEIKGVPRAGWAKKLVHGEAVRQKNLLELRDDLNRRGFKAPEDINITHADVTALCSKSMLPFLRKEHWEKRVAKMELPDLACGEGNFCVRAVRLTGLAGTLSWPTQPNRTFADEVAGRIRVIATLDEPPILVHSERWPEYDGSETELESLVKELGLKTNDSLVVVWGPLQDTITAAEEIRIRYEDAVDGVPNETRQPFEDGSTDFERILPGPNRMYPDTDSPPIEVTRDRVERLNAGLPPPPWVREAEYSAVGVPRSTIHYLIRRGGAALVDRVVEEAGADLRQACFFFGEKLKGLNRKSSVPGNVSTEKWCEFFRLVATRPVMLDAWKRLVTRMADDPQKPLNKLIDEVAPAENVPDWAGRIDSILADEKHHWRSDHCEGRIRFLMGCVMPDLRGIVPGTVVNEVIKQKLRQYAESKPQGITECN